MKMIIGINISYPRIGNDFTIFRTIGSQKLGRLIGNGKPCGRFIRYSGAESFTQTGNSPYLKGETSSFGIQIINKVDFPDIAWRRNIFIKNGSASIIDKMAVQIKAEIKVIVNGQASVKGEFAFCASSQVLIILVKMIAGNVGIIGFISLNIIRIDRIEKEGFISQIGRLQMIVIERQIGASQIAVQRSEIVVRMRGKQI